MSCISFLHLGEVRYSCWLTWMLYFLFALLALHTIGKTRVSLDVFVQFIDTHRHCMSLLCLPKTSVACVNGAFPVLWVQFLACNKWIQVTTRYNTCVVWFLLIDKLFYSWFCSPVPWGRRGVPSWLGQAVQSRAELSTWPELSLAYRVQFIRRYAARPAPAMAHKAYLVSNSLVASCS